MKNEASYEPLDMEPIKEKKLWNPILIILTIGSLGLLFIPVSTISVIIKMSCFTGLFILCIFMRKKYKVCISMIISILLILLEVYVIIALVRNHNAVEHMIEHGITPPM